MAHSNIPFDQDHTGVVHLAGLRATAISTATTDDDDILEITGNVTITMHTPTNNDEKIITLRQVSGTSTLTTITNQATLVAPGVLTAYYDGSSWIAMKSPEAADIALNTTHRSSDGSDHGYINQNVTTTGTPTFGSVTLSGTAVNEFSTDGTLADNSNDAVPTEQAVKTYVDSTVGAGASIQLNWRFSTSTTASDPGSKYFRYDNATPSSVTNIYVSDISESGVDASNILSSIDTGDRIYIQQNSDAGDFILALVSSTPTDNIGWWTIPITIEDSGTLPDNNQRCGWILFHSANYTPLWQRNGTVLSPQNFGDDLETDGDISFKKYVASQTGQTFTSSGTTVTFDLVTHGLHDGDEITVSNSSNTNDLPNGTYYVSVTDSDTFSVTAAGAGDDLGGTADWIETSVKAFDYNSGTDVLYISAQNTTVESEYLNILGKGTGGSEGEIRFGDDVFCIIKEYQDDFLRVHGDAGLEITTEDGYIKFGSLSDGSVTSSIPAGNVTLEIDTSIKQSYFNGGVYILDIADFASSETTFNPSSLDVDFIVNKQTSGQSFTYDAGTDVITMDASRTNLHNGPVLISEVPGSAPSFNTFFQHCTFLYRRGEYHYPQ
jgi:hypothetical protein